MTCPACHADARFKGYRPKGLVSTLGPLTVSRAYYHCPRCHQGHCPSDRIYGFEAGDLTPGAAEAVSLAGTLDSFAHAAETILPRLAGLRLAESTVERTTEAIGQGLGAALAAGATFGAERPWDWHKDTEGKTCAYVGIDLTGVGRQGPHDAAAEGEMVAVGMVYNPIPDDPQRWGRPTRTRPAWQARYVASLDGQEAIATPLRRQAGQVGMDRADRWIAVCDGGAGLEGLLEANFGRVEVVILDYYHASEHLGDLAKAWCSGDAAAARDQHQVWAQELKHRGGEAMLEVLRGLDVSQHPSAKSVWEATVTYFANQVHRMDYPTYLARGWQIGSGPVEAACKTVIGGRLKGSGMRWGHAGADAVSHLRALWLSEKSQWEAFWTERRKAA